MNPSAKCLRIAKTEGRICHKCGWMITKKNWNKGYRLCAGCFSASKGVSTNRGAPPYRDEAPELTGNN